MEAADGKRYGTHRPCPGCGLLIRPTDWLSLQIDGLCFWYYCSTRCMREDAPTAKVACTLAAAKPR